MCCGAELMVLQSSEERFYLKNILYESSLWGFQLTEILSLVESDHIEVTEDTWEIPSVVGNTRLESYCQKCV